MFNDITFTEWFSLNVHNLSTYSVSKTWMFVHWLIWNIYGKELITQAYFESMVPPEFQNYMRGRETQLVPIMYVGKNKDMANGGRRINFNIILEDKLDTK